MLGNHRTDIPRMSLDDVAVRLGDPRILKVVKGFKERSASIKRVVLVTLILAWTVFWKSRVPDEHSHSGDTLWVEGTHLFPWVALLTVLSVAWAAFVWWGDKELPDWVEKTGAVANYLGIWLMLHEGWNIAISTITFLPLATIVLGARFSRTIFYLGMAFSLVLLGTAAPAGYWAARPAFIPFALILLIGLPLTVTRLLSALYAISASAMASRDAQTRLVGMISHELRTPLNTICNASQLVDTTPLSNNDRALMSAVNNNAQSLLYRVNQVMDVAAIDQRGLYMVSEAFRVDELLSAVRDMVGQAAQDKGVRLSFDVDRRVPEALIGDVGRIEQVLSNLISNAIKFTPGGGTVEIRIDRREEQQDSPMAALQFQVIDTGIGIPDNDKAAIFSPFYQVERKHAAQEGIGLGLHIVKGVSEQMQGRLAVTDRDGGGTIVSWTVSLPVATHVPHRAQGRGVLDELQAHRKRVRSLRCLVIDDNRPNRDIMAQLLERAGHKPLFAIDGPSGLESLRTAPVDLVFLDMHMPGLTGDQVLKQMRASGMQMPVVVLSADAHPDTITRVHALGAQAYLLKPVDVRKLLEAIERYAGADPQSMPSTQAVTEPTSLPDLSALNVLRTLQSPAAVAQFLTGLEQELREHLAAIEQLGGQPWSSETHRHFHSLTNALRHLDDDQAVALLLQLAEKAREHGDTTEVLPELRALIESRVNWLRSQPEYRRVEGS